MIGDNVRRLRQEKRLSQLELAERVGVAQTMISQIETGIKRPSLDNASKLADALGVTVDDLLSTESVPS